MKPPSFKLAWNFDGSQLFAIETWATSTSTTRSALVFRELPPGFRSQVQLDFFGAMHPRKIFAAGIARQQINEKA